jgi:hypothetical protein
MPYLPSPLSYKLNMDRNPRPFIDWAIYMPTYIGLLCMHCTQAQQTMVENTSKYARAFARLGLYEKVRLLIGHQALFSFFFLCFCCPLDFIAWHCQ